MAAAIAAAWLTLATAATASAAEVVVVTVQDATGAAIAGAEGRVRTAAQTMLVAAVSASDGTLRLSDVPAGRHVLEVHATGFGVTRVPLDVGVSGEQAVTVVLQLAGLNEDVTVTAEAGRVETGSHVAGNSSEQRRGYHARAEHAVLDLRPSAGAFVPGSTRSSSTPRTSATPTTAGSAGASMHLGAGYR